LQPRDPQRGQDAHDLLLGNAALLLDDEHVDDVVRVGKLPPGPAVHRDQAVQGLLLDQLVSLLDVLPVAVESVDEPLALLNELHRPPARAAAHVDKKAAGGKVVVRRHGALTEMHRHGDAGEEQHESRETSHRPHFPVRRGLARLVTGT
jgi:hypothetical protein